jgi:hypothetical protein
MANRFRGILPVASRLSSCPSRLATATGQIVHCFHLIFPIAFIEACGRLLRWQLFGSHTVIGVAELRLTPTECLTAREVARASS